MPTTIGKVLLQDTETGDVICIIDSGHFTVERPVAATKYPASDGDYRSVGIYGVGVQAKMHVQAVSGARIFLTAMF